MSDPVQGSAAYDPTHGRIDPDIQRAVDEMRPPGIGERVAWENNLQRRRDAMSTRQAAKALGPEVEAEYLRLRCRTPRWRRAWRWLTGR